MDKSEVITLVNNLSDDEAKRLLEQMRLKYWDRMLEVLKIESPKKELAYGNVKPVSPEKIKVKIPDIVFEAVNELLNENWNSDEIVLEQDKIVRRIFKLAKRDGLKITWNKIFENNRLNFEDFYIKQWRQVKYDDEHDYPATFSFTKPPKKRYII